MLLVSAAVLLACAVVGTDARAAEACPNEALRRGAGASLPDCRAYEQVSPIEKNGVNMNIFPPWTEASVSGDALTFLGAGGIPGAVGEQEYPTYVARRGATDWSTSGLLPPQDCQYCASLLGWSEDQSLAFDRSKSLLTESLLARNADGSFGSVVPYRENEYDVDAVSADNSTVLFETFFGPPLTAEEALGPLHTYAWNRRTGALRLVGVLPDGAPAPEGAFAGAYHWQRGTRPIGQPELGGESQSYLGEEHTISTDGSQVVFTAKGSGQLYARENPTAQDARTVQVSVSQKTNGAGPGGADPNGPKPAAFMGAAADGSHVVFTSPQQLTNDATTGSADQGNDLYRYDPATGSLTDLVSDSVDPNGAEVEGILGMSKDASYIYFVANGVLAPGAPAGSCKTQTPEEANNRVATEGVCDLYLWHAGVITYISQLEAGGKNAQSDTTNWLAEPEQQEDFYKSSRVSANGRAVLFRSLLPLTGYDNHGCDQRVGETGETKTIDCVEYYRYSAANGRLDCVSCDPSGAPQVPGSPEEGTFRFSVIEHTNLRRQTNFNALTPIAPAKFLARNLSASGEQAFFDSPDSFTPGAVDGVEHAYEWEQNGSGSCRSESTDGGCIYLLSPPNDPTPSYFVDASADGNQAFILTERSLVGQDQDHLYDIYDVSVGGGLASQWPTSGVPCLSSDECRTAPAPATPPPAATVTFFASGNLGSPSPLPAPHATAAKVRLRGSVLRAGRASILVDVPAAGTVTVSGAHTHTARRRVLKRQSILIPVALDRKARSLLKRGRTVHLRLLVRYVPVSGAPSSAALGLVLR